MFKIDLHSGGSSNNLILMDDELFELSIPANNSINLSDPDAPHGQ